MGTLMQFLSMLGGIKPNFEVHPRGFLGTELESKSNELIVKSVLPHSPADKAGLKAGDRIQTAKGKSIDDAADLLEAVRKLPPGSELKLSIKRGDETKDITVELGKGL